MPILYYTSSSCPYYYTPHAHTTTPLMPILYYTPHAHTTTPLMPILLHSSCPFYYIPHAHTTTPLMPILYYTPHAHTILYSSQMSYSGECLHLFVRERRKWKKYPCCVRDGYFIQFKDGKVQQEENNYIFTCMTDISCFYRARRRCTKLV